MKAFGFAAHQPITGPESLTELSVEVPTPSSNDLLIEVKAVSVNPLDLRVTRGLTGQTLTEPRILGWDGSGVIVALGDQVTGFQVGDEVYWAGEFDRPGSYSQFQRVDHRLVALKPRSFCGLEAAALPMVALTAWEGLFECLEVQEQDRGKTLLIIGGAGGVGSMVIQLAKHAGLRVIATASRDRSHDWALGMGADLVVHPGELLSQIPPSSVDFIFNAVDVGLYWPQMVNLIRPRGKIVAVAHTAEKIPLGDLFNKRVSFHWEMVFIRPDTQADDLREVGRILGKVADLVDRKVLKSLVGLQLGSITLENLRDAHQRVGSGQTVGKVVLAGWA